MRRPATEGSVFDRRVSHLWAEEVAGLVVVAAYTRLQVDSHLPAPYVQLVAAEVEVDYYPFSFVISLEVSMNSTHFTSLALMRTPFVVGRSTVVPSSFIQLGCMM